MKYELLSLGLCGIGLMLVIAGSMWVNTIGDRMAWTEQQAVKFNEVSAAFHQAAHAYGNMHPGHKEDSVSAAELAAAKTAWEEQMKARDDAIAWRDLWKKVLYGGGMGAIVLGGMGYLVAKNAAEAND